jgi:hypothetical protein
MAPGAGNDTRDGWRRLRILLLQSPNYLFVMPGAVVPVTYFGVQIVFSSFLLSILGLRWTDA